MVVALNVELTRSEALRVAIMAQDGLARAVRPHIAQMMEIRFLFFVPEKKNIKKETLQHSTDWE